MRTIVSVLMVILLASCAPRAQQDIEVLAIGDSIMSWNSLSGRDVPSLVADKTGLQVLSFARNGANLTTPDGIPTQYVVGSWDHVILNGGGNDIAKVCLNASAAARVVDGLIAPDLTGAYSKFIDTIRENGPQIIILGYPPVSLRGGPFAPCAAALEVLSQRQAALAESLADVTFVNARDVIAPDDLQAYGIDRVHPTPYATNLMAEQIAAVIRRQRSQ